MEALPASFALLRELSKIKLAIFQSLIVLTILWRRFLNAMVKFLFARIKRVISSHTLIPSKARFWFASMIRKIFLSANISDAFNRFSCGMPLKIRYGQNPAAIRLH